MVHSFFVHLDGETPLKRTKNILGESVVSELSCEANEHFDVAVTL
jgi:hypothetical protein